MDHPEHLIYSNDKEIGYRRIKKRNKIYYIDENKLEITDQLILERINKLRIPKPWTKVWICKEENGCLQASGYDKSGKKQYIYHSEWAAYRNLSKFETIYEFGHDLGKIRNKIWTDIALKGWPKEKVIALALAILDETYVRVGNKLYSEKNKTYGLTTLRRKHIKDNSGNILFCYTGKWGKKASVVLENKKLCRLVKSCSELPGHEIFQYLDEEKKPHPLTSLHLNNYLREITGKNYTAKSFRTWGGSVTAIETLETALNIAKNNPRQKLTTIIVKQVSKTLRNTITICRKYYIHPAILQAIENNTINNFSPTSQVAKEFKELDNYEIQLMLLLKDYYQK